MESTHTGTEGLGYHVLQACDGLKGFDLITQHTIDLVITDIRMPKCDGIDLLTKVKRFPEPAPVVMLMTGLSDMPLEEAYARGVAAVLKKPFNIGVLEDVVAQLLATKAQSELDYSRSETCTSVPATRSLWVLVNKGAELRLCDQISACAVEICKEEFRRDEGAPYVSNADYLPTRAVANAESSTVRKCSEV